MLLLDLYLLNKLFLVFGTEEGIFEFWFFVFLIEDIELLLVLCEVEL